MIVEDGCHVKFDHTQDVLCHFRPDESNPFALPQCIFTSVAYGQCCTGLPCYESSGSEGICEMMYNFGNQILENFLITALSAAGTSK